MGFFGGNALYIRILRSDTIPDQTGDWPDEPKKSAVRAYLNAMNSHLPEIDPDWGGVNYLSEITPSGGISSRPTYRRMAWASGSLWPRRAGSAWATFS